ncbi:archaeosortase A [Halobacteriales archaeon QH_10_67_22]|nr:MAG: archaeosortase A [Halobacteriales archaeon QH_10_67_22]
MVLGGLLSGLAWTTQFSDPLAWLVIATFLIAAVLEYIDRREQARAVAVAGWVTFALFWFSLIYHFAVVQRSIIEGIGSVLAVPLAVYVGYLLWQGRDSLFVLSRAIVVMGAIFFPLESVTALNRPLVETVTRQTEFLIGLTGHDPAVVNGAELSHRDVDHYRNTFVFVTDLPYTETVEEHTITYTILVACTGLGSMAVFAGLIAAVEAPVGRKLRALAVSLPVIYVLNLFRNVFIAVTFGKQYLHLFPDAVLTLFASEEVPKVSYYVGDRIVSQSLSVVALVAVTYLVVRELPEILTIVEDLLFVVTGSEWDLVDALDTTPVRADGGER